VGTPMPIARARGASCVVDGRIYLFGGTDQGGGIGTSDTQEYDPVNDSWRARAPMITPRISARGAVVDGRCHVIGGAPANSQRQPLPAHEIYDPASNSWSTGPPMPTARYAHAMAALDGRIYTIGGTTDGFSVTGLVEIFDSATETWSTGPSLNTPRATHAASALGEKIYVVGGTRNPTVQQFSSVEVFDSASNEWAFTASMPTARWELASAVAEGRVYAVGGGVSEGARREIEEYEPAGNAWVTRQPLPLAMFRLFAESLDGKVYAFGGLSRVEPGWAASDEVLIYSPPVLAPSFSINPGLNDAWFDSATAGQGFFITVFADIQSVFLAWFTYDTERPPQNVQAVLGEPGHRWLTAFGSYQENIAELDVELTSGGIFDSAEPLPGQVADGTISVEFHGCNAATITYDSFSAGVSGEIQIERIALDNVSMCEALSLQ